MADDNSSSSNISERPAAGDIGGGAEATSTPSSPLRRGPTSGTGNRRRERARGYREGGGFRPKRGDGGNTPEDSSKGRKNTVGSGAPGVERSGPSASSTPKSSQQGAGGSVKKPNNKGKYTAKKRAPPREDFDVKPTDVFVNEKSHFVAQLSKCKKLFEKGHREIYLHGLGKAIPRAINIAFELRKFYHNTVDYTVKTSTLEVYDDIVDLEDSEQPATVRTRNVSSVDIKELGQWLGVTAYEIWVWLTSLTVFTVLLTLKCDGNVDMSWWTVFSPLFIGDALNAYFVVTVFIRMYIAKRVRPATLRTLWSLLQLVLVFLFEFLLCWKLTEPNQFDYSEVMAPLFILSQFIMIRACQLH